MERMGSVGGEGLCWRGRALLERKGPVGGEYERAHVPRSEKGSTILGQNRGIKKGSRGEESKTGSRREV